MLSSWAEVNKPRSLVSIWKWARSRNAPKQDHQHEMRLRRLLKSSRRACVLVPVAPLDVVLMSVGVVLTGPDETCIGEWSGGVGHATGFLRGRPPRLGESSQK